MITSAAYYMGRDASHASDLTDEIRANVVALLPKVNGLLADYINATGNPVGGVNSGWRPPSINAATPNAARKSWHMLGKAIDIGDASGRLDAWLLTEQGQGSLEFWGLWHEHPDDTPRWAHVQDAPYGSWRPGKSRTFRAR